MEKPVFTVSVENEEDGPTGGYIPDDLPYDVPIIGDQRNVSLYQIHAFSPNRVGNGQEETYYNAYDEGKLPAIRNQGSEGACWAFASMGAVEMDLITDGNADKDTIDLSELQLAYFTAHNYDDPKDLHDEDQVFFTPTGTISSYLSNGGNSTIAYRAMANLVGPVTESDVPYSRGSRYTVEDEPEIEQLARVS